MDNNEILPISRLANGLLPGVIYVRDSKGMIDWRKMIDPEFLVPNRQSFEKQNKEVPATVQGLEDKDLLILLSGIKNLARVRGFTSVKYSVTTPHPEYVAVDCHIEWIPNFETEGRVITTGGTADAHPGNTSSFGKFYLCAIAENRAFVRCVRNFLNINIVGQDEVGAKSSPEEIVNAPAQTSPAALLEKLMNEKHVTFEEIKSKMVTEGVEGAAELNSIVDIPKVKTFELIERLRKKKS